MESLIPVLLLALIIIPVVFLYNEHQKRKYEAMKSKSNSDLTLQERQEKAMRDLRFETNLAKTDLDKRFTEIEKALLDLKTDIASIKVSMGWSNKD